MMHTQRLREEIAELDSRAETLVVQLNETLQQIKLKREMLYRLESGEEVHYQAAD